MKLIEELHQFQPDPALQKWVESTVSQLIDQAEKDGAALKLAAIKTEKDSAALKLADIKIQALTLELAYYKRIRFGKKSEALVSIQGELFEETLETDVAAIKAETEQLQPATPQKKPRPRAGRQPLPDHLPRVVHRHEPESTTCSDCANPMHLVREDVTEQLDVEPARFFVHQHIRPQYACRCCQTMQAAPIPAAIIDGGLPTPGLLAWVTVQKFLDHLPLYRIESIAARSDVILSRSTLAEWVGRIGVALQPLADHLRTLLLQRSVIHADETPVQQLDPGQGKTKRAYLWTYRSNDLEPGSPIVVFDYQTSRAGVHVRDFLKDWRGSLMVDDYAGYKALFGHHIIELGCMAHARRKFFDLHAANQNPIAAEALRRIGELYVIEREAKAGGPAERLALRQKEAKPKLDALHAWLMHTRTTTAPGGALMKAIDYTLRRWPALIRYADSGILPIDNNPAENSIRPIAIGKKNWLFVGSERAGDRAASIHTLLGTAKLNGLDPYAWLKDTLEKLPTWPNSRIDELLPLMKYVDT